MKLIAALLIALTAAPAFAAEPEDKDRTILTLRHTLAAERLERLRLEYIITKSELDKVATEIAAKDKAAKEKKTDDQK